MGAEFPFCKRKKVPEMDGGDGHTALGLYLKPLHRTLKNGYSGALYVRFTTAVKNKLSKTRKKKESPYPSPLKKVTDGNRGHFQWLFRAL